jgi:hypothetical protein
MHKKARAISDLTLPLDLLGFSLIPGSRTDSSSLQKDIERPIALGCGHPGKGAKRSPPSVRDQAIESLSKTPHYNPCKKDIPQVRLSSNQNSCLIRDVDLSGKRIPCTQLKLKKLLTI